MRLDKRHAKIAAATGKPDEGEIEETAQEKLEREAGELTSQLKKAERAEAQAQEKDQKDKAKRKLQGARKCQRHPPRPQQDDRISTRNAHRPELHLRSHNIFRPSTLGT